MAIREKKNIDTTHEMLNDFTDAEDVKPTYIAMILIKVKKKIIT